MLCKHIDQQNCAQTTSSTIFSLLFFSPVGPSIWYEIANKTTDLQLYLEVFIVSVHRMDAILKCSSGEGRGGGGGGAVSICRIDIFLIILNLQNNFIMLHICISF